MNIKQAKTIIFETIKMYLVKDENDNYVISKQRQRPVLLYGPPGIGKTEIVGQVCAEMGIGFVNYSITHHTRQSAIGLPTIKDVHYGDDSFRITEYTMSEIVNGVYDYIEKFGVKEGVLFIDEINCVSESLAPAMLDLLQNKRFGPHKLPPGWILISAGNPAEYNHAAREFDMVTLDRLKVLDVEPNYNAFRDYAYKQALHEAIIGFLNLHEDYLFHVEKSVDGLRFSTPRGWEDLSIALKMYEKFNFEITLTLARQYIQHEEVAKEFFRYFLIYKKHKSNLDIEKIFKGDFAGQLVKSGDTPFEEKLAIIEILLGGLNAKTKVIVEYHKEFSEIEKILDRVVATKDLNLLKTELSYTEKQIKRYEGNLDLKIFYQNLKKHLEVLVGLVSINEVENYLLKLKTDINTKIDTTEGVIGNCILFVEQSFGEGQELVALLVNMMFSVHVMEFMYLRRVKIFDKFNAKLTLHGKDSRILDDIKKLAEED